MKSRFLIGLIALLLTVGCADEAKEETQVSPETVQENDSIRTIEGEFLYVSDAAVIKGDDFIYGVQMDSLAKVLAETVEAYKLDDFDLIPVVIEAKVVQNPGKPGWEEVVEIKEIIEVAKGTVPTDRNITKKDDVKNQ